MARRTVHRSIHVTPTIEELAECFCCLDSDEQAEFLEKAWAMRLGAEDAAGRDRQALFISNSIDKNEGASRFREGIQ